MIAESLNNENYDIISYLVGAFIRVNTVSELGFHCDNLHSCYTMQLSTFVIVYRWYIYYHEHVFYSYCKAPRILRALGAV